MNHPFTIDDRLAVVAISDGVPVTHAATVVHRDQYVVHVDCDRPLTLPIGAVVGLLSLGAVGAVGAVGALGVDTPDPGSTARSPASLAVVAESIGDTVAALRLLERRG